MSIHRHMKLPLILLLLLSPWALSAETADRSDGSRPSMLRFEAYLDGLMAAQFSDYKLAGATFTLIYDYEPVFTKGYGFADIATQSPVEPYRHLFRPGSVSKLFTWTAVMQLVEQGKLDLNTDVGEYVTQFDIPNSFDTPLTLTHLMTHTPGLEDGAAGYLFADEPEDYIGLANALERYMPEQVIAPGTYAAYSNWATGLAGLIVANVSGMSFEEYVARNIFAPLGMTQATFEEPLPPELADDMATGYVEVHGALDPFGFEYIKNFGPAGALSASAGAMSKFMLMHLNEGRYKGVAVLQPETVKLMHSKLHAHDPHVAAMAHGFYEIWRNGTRFIGHGGDTIAFHSELVLDDANGFGFFISFNAGPGAEARGAIVDGVIDYFYPPAAAKLPSQPPAGSAQRIAEVVGAYRLNRRSHSKLEGIVGLAGDLKVAPGPAGGIELAIPGRSGRFVEVEPWVFQQVDRQERLVFEVDEDGRVTHGFIASLPIMAAEKLSWWEQASTHQLILVTGVLAALFTIINTVRNRGLWLSGAAQWGRRVITAAAICYLLFVIIFALVLAGVDMNRVVFEFPPAGTSVALLFALFGTIFTAVSAGLLVPVWRSKQCAGGARWRYLWLVCVFVAFSLVLAYWNLLGWNYY
jgi:CubicO group peptidase (beta-lactamase class C family)